MAIWFPYLPADRIMRNNRSDSAASDPRPLVIADKVKGALRLAALSPQARELGLAENMTLADARARIPALRVHPLDTLSDQALIERIADDCDRFSPIVALDPPNGLILEITGCAHLFGGEAELRKHVLLRYRKAGFHTHASIASAPDAARALVRYSRTPQVAPGEDEAAIRPLPIAALNIPETTCTALSRAGLKTIADLADREQVPLAERFGQVLPLKLRRTLAREIAPITARRIVPVCTAQRRFAEPIAAATDIDAILSQLASEVADILSQRREGGRAFEASFFRTDGAVRRIAVETGQPNRDPRALLRLLHERMDTLADPLDPGFGFDLVRLCVPRAAPLDAAQVSLDGEVIVRSALTSLTDRLVARLTPDRVTFFAPLNSHIPERAQRYAPTLAASLRRADSFASVPLHSSRDPPTRPGQIFDPPQHIETLAELPDGPPIRFRWRRVSHTIARAEGPERIAPEWFRDPFDAQTRDYYRVEDRHGRRFWLFRAGLYGGSPTLPRWYIHGLSA